MNNFLDSLNLKMITNYTKRAEKILNEIKTESNILAIGTGGSYVTGLFFKRIINIYKSDCYCDVIKPFDLYNINVNRFSYVFIFSYSLCSYDVDFLLKELIRNNNIVNIIIVTAKSNGKTLFQNNKKVKILTYSDGEDTERRYVSYKGIYLPIAIFSSVFNDFYKFNLEKIHESIPMLINSQEIHVFYDASTYCIANLIERHFAEIGLAYTILHEKRDFAHGRMNILHKEDEIIYLKSEKYDPEYDVYLYNYLLKTKQCKILNKVGINSKLNYFDYLIIMLQWIEDCTKNKGIIIDELKDNNEERKLFVFKKGENNE